jgi:hypothetical protein
VGFHDAFDKEQPEPASLDSKLVGYRGAREALEESRLVFFGDANSVVAYGHGDRIARVASDLFRAPSPVLGVRLRTVSHWLP